jgi:hypothetical protein
MIILFFAVVLLVGVLGGITYLRGHSVSQDPQKLFYGSLERNLSEKGVTCSVSKSASGTTQALKVSLDLASKTDAHSFLTVSSQGTTVQTEEMVLKNADYLRYTSVKADTKSKAANGPDFSKILNKWIKPDQNNSTLFSSTVLGGCVVPLTALSTRDEGVITTIIEKGQAFKTDFTKTGTTRIAGEPVRQYHVTIQAVPYVTLMQAVGKAYGLDNLKQLNIKDYDSKKPRQAIFSVDTGTGRLAQIQFTDETRVVEFRDYGKVPQLTAPAKTISNKEASKLVAR